MSPNMKLSLLALVGAASAIPHYGGHSKFHSKGSGYAGPTGGWPNSNHTRPHPTGTGVVVPVDYKTTTIDGTLTSTETIYSTVYLTKSKPSAGGGSPSSVGAAEASGSGAACGPATVYVTATNKVTVTVPAGGALSSAYTQAPPPSSATIPDVPEAASSSSASKSTQYVYVSPSPVKSPSPATEAEATPSTSSTPPVATPEQATTSSTSTTAVATPEEATTYTSPATSAAAPSSSAAQSSTVASSAAPSSSGTPSYSGGKRGLVYRWDGAADVKSFAGKNFGFAWNWESDTKGDIGALASNFIPTLRTLDNAGDWSEKVEAAISAGSKVVFGLNEPDIETQANLGVAAACDAWKKYMNPIKEAHPDVIIAGPAVSSTDAAGKGLDYLQQFVDQCPEAKFDVINIHWYGPSSAGVDAFSTHVDTAISQFGKNAWVTEFGLYAGESADAAKSFLTDALTYLDGNDKCDGYSYFAVGSFDPNSNLLGNAESLSDTGKVYVA